MILCNYKLLSFLCQIIKEAILVSFTVVTKIKHKHGAQRLYSVHCTDMNCVQLILTTIDKSSCQNDCDIGIILLNAFTYFS